MLCVGFSLWELRLSRSTGSRHSGFSRSQHPRVGPGREGRGAAPEWVSSPRPCQWRHPQQHAGPHLWELGHLFGLLSFGTFFFPIMSRRLLVLELQGGMAQVSRTTKLWRLDAYCDGSTAESKPLFTMFFKSRQNGVTEILIS